MTQPAGEQPTEPPADGDRGADPEAVIRRWLAETGVEHELGGRPGEYVLQLPGERKLKTTVSVLVGDRGLSASAFVVRRPDENHEAFYRWLLSRNARLPGLAFALDPLGDVYLTARLPIAGVSVDTLDELLGAILTTADDAFNELLTLGFATSIRREWAWRLERGESTRNLEAFQHLRPGASGADVEGEAGSAGNVTSRAGQGDAGSPGPEH